MFAGTPVIDTPRYTDEPVGAAVGVLVGGTGVLVGGTGVLVGGTGVLVGGTAVLVGALGCLSA